MDCSDAVNDSSLPLARADRQGNPHKAHDSSVTSLSNMVYVDAHFHARTASTRDFGGGTCFQYDEHLTLSLPLEAHILGLYMLPGLM
jgi:hypothetical protein